MKLAAVLYLVFMTVAACGRSPAAPTDPVPLEQFLASVRTAQYADFRETEVENQQSFEEMRTFILDRYDSAHAVRTYLDHDAVFDCLGADQKSCVPVRRITLADLTRFSTVAAFLARSPDGKGGDPPSPTSS
jgi:hypothetical protein